MKRSLRGFVLAMAMVLLCTACAKEAPSSSGPAFTLPGGELDTGAVLALVAPAQEQDAPLVQAVWGALTHYAGENGLTKGFYKATEGEAMATLQLAVKGGAELVVLAGTDMGTLLERAQLQYPALAFVLVSDDERPTLGTNSATLTFLPEQAGWLAGYAAVQEAGGGLAYFETEDVTARRYALGFFLGAEAAADEMGLAAQSVAMHPIYSAETPQETILRTRERLAAGCSLLFANDSYLQQEALKEAAVLQVTAFAAGYDYTSAQAVAAVAQSSPRGALAGILSGWQAGRFPGGTLVEATVANEGEALSLDETRLQNFTQQMYENALAAFARLEAATTLKSYIQDGRAPSPLVLPYTYLSLPGSQDSAALLPESSSASSSAAA